MKKGDFMWHFNSRKISEKGISLVALVVTIVVSLILVGMTVSMMTGNEGVLEKASKAVSDSVKAEEMEKVQKAIINAIAENGTEGTVNVEKLKEELEGLVESTEGIEDGAKSWDVVGAQTGFTYRILEDGTVTKYENSSDIPSAALQSIQVKNPQITIAINAQNKTAKILTQLTPSYTTEVLSYTSSNSAVASVDSNGVVTAHSVGTANITISGTSPAGSSISAVCEVTVTEMEITLRGISGVTSEVTLIKGNSTTLTPVKEPQNATDTLVYESSNTNVATVSSSGLVRAVGGGSATITVKGTNYPSIVATCAVTVKVPLTGISMQENATIIKGNTTQLEPTLSPLDTTETLIYESSDTNIATVSSSGLITAVNGGTATITARGSESSEVTATCAVTVKVPLTGISGIQPTETIIKNNRVQLVPTKSPSDTTESLVYESSNTNVATISNTGEIIATGGGTATITVKGNESTNVTAVCTVTVKVPLTGISVTGSATLEKDDTLQLQPTKTPPDTTESLTYSSSNDSIATVSSSGLVTAVAPGTATITVRGNESTGVTATCTVTVKISLTGIGNVPTSQTIVKNATYKLEPSKTPATSTESFTYESNNTSVATVAADGTITAVAGGSATITVRGSESTSVTKTCDVTVIVPLTGITVTSMTTLEKGEHLQLTPTKTPSDTTESLTYESSNTNVATVSNTGEIIATGGGSATITVKGSTSTTVTATCNLTVKVTLTGIGNVPASASVIEDKTVTLTPSKTPVDSTESLTYESSNNSIATVSSSGVISGISAGTATITVKGNPSTGVTATCTVTVQPKLTGIGNVPSTATLAMGNTLTLEPSKTPPSAPESLNYFSSNNSIATVSNAGVITPVSAGSITITVRGSVTTSVYATCTLTVTTLTGIGNVPSTASLAPNGTLQLEPSKTPPDSTETLEYTTSNSSVATVSSSGLITGVAVGTATITVKGSVTTSVQQTCVVTVQPAGAIMTNQNRTLSGEATGYSSKNPVIPEGFKPVNTTNASWTYNSGNTIVGGWDSGLVITDDSQGREDYGNEFVWVPCTSGSATSELVSYSRKNYTGTSASSCSDATNTTTAPGDGNTYSAIPYNEENQITKYGGFWVARYEASLPETTTIQSESNNNVYTKIPESKKNGKIWNQVDYTHSYVAAQKMVNNSGVKSGIITGKQWDTIMQWYEKASIDVGTSMTWGSYYDTTYSVSGMYFDSNSSTSTWASGSTSHTKNTSTPTKYLYHASGLNSNGYQKNIADLGGNFWEWTAEIYSSYCIERGGSAYNIASSNPAGYRNSANTGSTNYSIGFRVVLYIQPQAVGAGVTMTSQNRNLNGTTSGYSSKNPVIPQGFRPVETETASWTYTNSSNNVVTGWDNGLVITDDSNGTEGQGNEFVWVPCTSGSATSELVSYSRKNYTESISASSFSDDSTAIPVTDETTQITNYGGFWVARYEAGLEGSQTSNAEGANNSNASTPVSKKGTKIWNCVNYTNSYTAANRMVNNSGVKSGIITGKQWDTIMQWYEKASIAVGTTMNWGTYADLAYSVNGNYFILNSNYTQSEWISGSRSYTGNTYPMILHGSGLNSNGYQKNIADLGGNAEERTAEKYSSNPVVRGGGAFTSAHSCPVYSRYCTTDSSASGYSIGFRVVLYIQPQAVGAGVTMTSQNRTLNGTTTGYSHKNPLIPQGFRPLATETANWTYNNNNEVTGWNSGLVITDDTQGREGYGNEFVWIPVENIVNYTRTPFNSETTNGTDGGTNSTKIQATTGSYYTEAMPSEEQTSVSTYKGYYIGRYEAGDSTKPTGLGQSLRTSGASQTNAVVVKKGYAPYNYITRTNAETRATGMKSAQGYSATTKLCSSYAWDTALNFIQSKGGDLANYGSSSPQGNYKNVAKSYTDITGTIQSVASGTSAGVIPTGQTTAVCNIYDMGGNVVEVTTETCSYSGYSYTHHGGCYNHSYGSDSAGRRDRNNGNANDYVGFRITLYL